MKKKILAWLLTLVMAGQVLMPVTVAAGSDEGASEITEENDAIETGVLDQETQENPEEAVSTMEGIYAEENTSVNASNPFSTGQCTWWAYKRWTELLGYAPAVISGNAGGWYANSAAKGYSRGSTPAVGAIACWNDGFGNDSGHVAIVEAVTDSSITVSEYNWNVAKGYDQATIKLSNINRASSSKPNRHLEGYIYLPGNPAPTPTQPPAPAPSANNPVGVVDSYGSGMYSVSAAGWAFDPDDTGTALEIHIYLGDKIVGKTIANAPRSDVNRVYGCGENHGFQFDITVAKEFGGVHTLNIYAINVGGGENSLLCSYDVNIGEDNEGPKISDCKISNLTPEGYTVTCRVTDENGVDRVQFPTWTNNNGQDDLPGDWPDNPACTGVRNGDVFTYQVHSKDHNNERGTYTTHIYAFDKYGNVGSKGLDEIVLPEVPQGTMEFGDDFFAEVQNVATGTFLTAETYNASFQKKNNTRQQVWHFVKNKDQDSYTVLCEENEALGLKVDGGLDENQTNVSVDTRSGSNAEMWRILKEGEKYYLQPLCSKLRVLNASESSGENAQIYAYNTDGGTGMKIINVEPSITTLLKGNMIAAANYNGHYYQIFDQGMSWSDAKRACEAAGGHLVTITDSEEQKFIEALLTDHNASMNQYWIGMFQYKGGYTWVNGESSDYTNWDSGEPNGVTNTGLKEYCIQLYNNVEAYRRFKWNDKDNANSEGDVKGFFGTDKVGVICEFEKLGTCTLSYDANGGENAPGKEVEYQGAEVTVSDKKPVRKGYDFMGWAETADATTVGYYPGDKYLLNSDSVLYAVWKRAFDGTCGASLTWELSDSGTLTVSGNGEMDNYTYKSEMPWYKYIDQIHAIVIEDGVTSIGDYAFYGMTKLTEITIAESVKKIGAYAFKNSTSLADVQLPTSLTKLGESAFYGCTSLSKINIPEGLYTIWGYTFKNCTGLAEVTLPSTLIKIDEAAFYGCTALKELVIPDNVSIIGIYCFKNCTSLQTVTLPKKLQTIREAAFYGTALRELVIPEQVTEVGKYAFKNCTELKSVQWSKSLKKIDDSAFYACTGLTELELPDTVTEIADYAFRKCTGLQKVKFSAGLKTIGESSFYGCENLTELALPEGVETAKGYAFKGCTKVTNVTLPSTLKVMGESLFYGCIGLSRIEIPAKVSAVGDYAFSRCEKLGEIKFLGDAPTIGNNTFAKVTAKVNYPNGNTTWTQEKQKNYGGTLSWSATK